MCIPLSKRQYLSSLSTNTKILHTCYPLVVKQDTLQYRSTTMIFNVKTTDMDTDTNST